MNIRIEMLIENVSSDEPSHRSAGENIPGKVLPRTIVGELVITRVEGNTATAIVTRTQSGEAYVGDNIELQ